MLSYLDTDLEARAMDMGRYHPWTTAVDTPDRRYVDFKSHPDQILETLEDLRGLEDTAIARGVVDLLSWANSPGQPYETNDFGLRPIKTNGSPDCSPHPLELTGRVTFLFRDLRLNCHRGMIELLTRELLAELKRTDPGFVDGCIGVSRWPHLFTELEAAGSPAEGVCTVCNFWAWGQDEASTYAAADRTLANLRSALLAVWPTVKP